MRDLEVVVPSMRPEKPASAQSEHALLEGLVIATDRAFNAPLNTQLRALLQVRRTAHRHC